MALSSSESALLTQTCENMNVAANTCREVLEIVRNLGNTGIVDIATHDNTAGAHANDGTLAHVLNETSTSFLALGPKRYNGWGGQSSYPAHVRWGTGDLTKSSDIVLVASSHGETNIATKTYIRNELFLTDQSENRIAFSQQTGIWLKGVNAYSSYFIDSNGDRLQWQMRFCVGRSNSWGDTNTVADSPYSSIQFYVSTSLSNAVCAISLDKDGLLPGETDTESLGNSGRVWKDAYLKNAVTVTSDRREKKNVAALGLEAVDFIKALRPVAYRFVEGVSQRKLFDENGNEAGVAPATEGVRTHWGLIAQEVKEALDGSGIEDVAVWCLANKNDPDSRQSLRYEELIAPMIKVIQNQQERIEALERKVA